jgi:hypothetical protein
VPAGPRVHHHPAPGHTHKTPPDDIGAVAKAVMSKKATTTAAATTDTANNETFAFHGFPPLVYETSTALTEH